VTEINSIGGFAKEYQIAPIPERLASLGVTLQDVVTALDRNNGKVGAGRHVLTDSVAAVSVGIIDGVPMLDLPYVEDVRAETDMNVVATGTGRFIEVQGTAERTPFDRAELDVLLDLGLAGIASLTAIQSETLARPLSR
jgi:ribonuclease PH